VVSAAVHGVGGDALMTRISPEMLPQEGLDGDSARALGLFAAGAVTGFAVLAVGLVAAYMRTPRSVLLHGAPATLTAVAALAGWGALSI
jgi:hypothetical protein